MDAIFSGVADVYYALMTSEDTAAAAPAYGAPALMGQSVEIKIKPNYREGNLDASNIKLRKKKKVNYYTVSVNTANIAPAVQQILLNRTLDANHVQQVNGSTDPAKVAIAFKFTYDDGSAEFWWLYKGQFAEAEKDGKTEGDNIDYQTPTLEGDFVRRADTGDLSSIADENDDAIPAGVFANWYAYVYEPSGSATPDVDTLPIGAVVAVAALPASGISVTAVYVLTADDGDKDAGTMWRYVSAAWVQYGV